MPIESLDMERDHASVFRLWREVGWLEQEKKDEDALRVFVRSADARVARIDGDVESLTLSHPGRLRYLDRDLPLCAVTGVTTSHVARRQGLAKRLAADLIARSVAQGALVAGLGMFDQGFYNQLGFGSGSYEHVLSFDPADLAVRTPYRAPRRITVEDWQVVHDARLVRQVRHGNATLLPFEITQAEMIWTKKGFGLGYGDVDSEGKLVSLSHFIWWTNEGGEHGPYRILSATYQHSGQLLELLALIKSLGDQVHTVRMLEPAHVQLQDLMTQPIKHRRVTERSQYASGSRAMAWWQMRICDLAGCLRQTSLTGETVRFNLTLSDPIAAYLPGPASAGTDAPWRGVAGEYVVTLGQESAAEAGYSESLPTLKASVNAFTRMWLGVRPASGLAITDDLHGPETLLKQLDHTLRLPVPRIDWEF